MTALGRSVTSDFQVSSGRSEWRTVLTTSGPGRAKELPVSVASAINLASHSIRDRLVALDRPPLPYHPALPTPLPRSSALPHLHSTNSSYPNPPQISQSLKLPPPSALPRPPPPPPAPPPPTTLPPPHVPPPSPPPSPLPPPPSLSSPPPLPLPYSSPPPPPSSPPPLPPPSPLFTAISPPLPPPPASRPRPSLPPQDSPFSLSLYPSSPRPLPLRRGRLSSADVARAPAQRAALADYRRAEYRHDTSAWRRLAPLCPRRMRWRDRQAHALPKRKSAPAVSTPHGLDLSQLALVGSTGWIDEYRDAAKGRAAPP